MYNSYNYRALGMTYACICVDLLHHYGEFDSLVLELQQLFSATQWKTAIFVLAAA